MNEIQTIEGGQKDVSSIEGTKFIFKKILKQFMFKTWPKYVVQLRMERRQIMITISQSLILLTQVFDAVTSFVQGSRVELEPDDGKNENGEHDQQTDLHQRRQGLKNGFQNNLETQRQKNNIKICWIVRNPSTRPNFRILNWPVLWNAKLCQLFCIYNFKI